MSTIKRQAPGAVIAGRKAGGEFAAHDRVTQVFRDPDDFVREMNQRKEEVRNLLLDEASTGERIGRDDWQKVEKVLEDSYDNGLPLELITIDPVEHLEDNQIDIYLSGDPASSGAYIC